jgi:heptosyltransferase-1
VVHALPAISEARAHNAQIHFSWVVEEAFSDIAVLHRAVDEVIPVAIRRWRKSWLTSWPEIQEFRARLGDYDLIIDSQGLVKSALLSRLATGPRHGFDRRSAREGLASAFYQVTHPVATNLHAVERQKLLFAQCLGYESEPGVDYGLASRSAPSNGIMLLHGTTWSSKEWPESYWRELSEKISEAGYQVIVPSGDEIEYSRAKLIAGLNGESIYRPALSDLIEVMRSCSGVVSVDSGLGHLAAALQIPLVGVFGATDPGLTGMTGADVDLIVSDHLPCIPCRKRECEFRKPGDSSNIYPPCYKKTTPERVWQALQLQIGKKNSK